MNTKPRVTLLLFLGLFSLILTGCATSRIDTSPAVSAPDQQAVWAVLPLVNNTSTPYAGNRAQQQLAALLGASGVRQVLIAPSFQQTSAPLPIGSGSGNQQSSLEWARGHHARYALVGSVDEWHYKIGLEGQPAVGFTLRLVDLESGTTIWSGAASATGNAREGLAVLSQQVLRKAIKKLL